MKLLGYSIDLNILILIGILYLIMVVNAISGSCKREGMYGSNIKERIIDLDNRFKSGFSPGNSRRELRQIGLNIRNDINRKLTEAKNKDQNKVMNDLFKKINELIAKIG